MWSPHDGVLLARDGAAGKPAAPQPLSSDAAKQTAGSSILAAMTSALNASLFPMDTALFGERGTGCAYLVRGTAKTALIDPGAAAGAPRMLDALRGVHLDYVLVTHVHLDHAGAAGHIAAAHPESQVVVHPRGLPHLVDPRRLVAGVAAASPDLATLYGEPVPIDAARLLPVEDGHVLSLGWTSCLVAIATPGHSPHHVAFFEPSSGTLFVGDAAGHRGTSGDVPLTVPPRFDVAASANSIQKLRALRPQRLAYAHFGIAGDARERLATYPREVEAWLAKISQLRQELGDDDVAKTILAEPRHAGLSEIGRHVVRLCVRGALLTLADRAATAR